MITSLWWVLRFFYRTNQKIIRYYVSKTNSALTIGELSPVELRNLKNQVAYDWIGKIDVYGEKEEKDPFCLGSGPDLYKFQKSLGISHLVLQPRTFITAQKVLFCEELELNSRAINLLFPCLQGKTFVEINLRILQ